MLRRLMKANFEIPHRKKNYCVKTEGWQPLPPSKARVNHLELNKVLCQYQFGFRPSHSTCLALIDVIDNIYDQLDARFKVCGIYLDVQKAFDSVSHDILLDKLYL